MSRKIYAYTRVSTTRQDDLSQETQIQNYIANIEHAQLSWIQDNLSGAIPWQDRQIAQIIKTAQTHDIIVVTEITRIERTLHGVLQFAFEAQQKGIAIHVVKSKIILDDSLNSKITLSMLALAGEIERDMNNARARAGVQTRREKGLPLGRIPGTKVKLKLDEYASDIPKWRHKKLSLRSIAKLTDSSVPTVKRWLERMAEKPNTDATT